MVKSNLLLQAKHRYASTRDITFVIIAAIIWAAVIVLLNEAPWETRVTTATMLAAVFLWVLSPLSLSYTSFMAVLVLVITRVIPLETGLGGFATGSLFLILSGLMLAEAINKTDLAQRTAYFVLGRFGGTPGGALAGLFVILQILSFLVPSAAVRITLLLPTVKTIIARSGVPPEDGNLSRMLIIGLAFGATVTGSGVLPAALANIITVDLLTEMTGQRIYYLQWFIYVFPVGVVLAPIMWYILTRTFPPELKEFPGGAREFKRALSEMGSLGIREIKCLGVLTLTMVLWVTESVHGLHTAVPAMLAVVLLGLPVIGIVKWDNMFKINWSTIFLVGFTLSLGAAMNSTGTATYLADGFFNSLAGGKLSLSPVTAVFAAAVCTQIIHLFMGNVTTVLVAVIPLVVEIAPRLGVDPLLLGVVTGVSSLYGFLFPVETISNIVVYGTGYLRPLDMVKPGIYATAASILILTLTAYIWWPLLGLVR